MKVQMAGWIRFAQPFPPYNLSSVFLCSFTVLKICTHPSDLRLKYTDLV